jgi:hypothetical protein
MGSHFQNRYRIFPAASEIINFADPRPADEFVHEPDHVERMDIISDLFPFVTKDFVDFSFQVALDRVSIFKSLQLPDVNPSFCFPIGGIVHRQI